MRASLRSVSARARRLLLVTALLVTAGAAGVSWSSTASADTGDAHAFSNPVLATPEGAPDPQILRDGSYYYSVVTLENRIDIWRSPTLSGVGSGDRQTVWTHTSGDLGGRVWAPEIYHYQGTWYIYFVVGTADTLDNQRIWVISNSNADPFSGGWTAPRRLVPPGADYWAIDPTIMSRNGRFYIVYSGWIDNGGDHTQHLYIAPMSDPFTISGSRVQISEPQYDWEKQVGGQNGLPWVNEGPAVLQRNGRTFITYSASGCWTNSYSLGMLTLPDDRDPLDASAWSKSPTPVFSGANGVYAPGHNAFVSSPDGTEDYLVYHANPGPGQGCGAARSTRIQKINYRSDGTPDFGAPVCTCQELPEPSGDVRIEAERADRNDADTPSQPAASGGQVVGHLDNPDSWVEFTTVDVPADGTYGLRVRYDAGAGAASQTLTVNGGDQGTVDYPNTGWGTFQGAVRGVDLHAGRNTIRLTHRDGFAEVDAIEVFR